MGSQITPPAGFTLDQAPATSAPPAGYTLDSEPPSYLSQVGHNMLSSAVGLIPKLVQNTPGMPHTGGDETLPPGHQGLPDYVQGVKDYWNNLGHAIMHPGETFAADPLGTVANVAAAVRGGAEVAKAGAKAVPDVTPEARAAAGEAGKNVAGMIPGADTVKKAANTVRSLLKLKDALANKPGEPPAAPAQATPKMIQAAHDYSSAYGRYFDMLDSLKGPEPTAVSEAPAAASAPAPGATPTAWPASQPSAPPPTPEPQPQAQPAPEGTGAYQKYKASRKNPAKMATALLGDIRSTQAAKAAPAAPAPAPAAPATVEAPPAAVNPYEAAARGQKASALAATLYMGGTGIPIEDAGRMSPEHWTMAAKAAGVKPPSAATAAEALTHLKKLWDLDSIAQQLKKSMEEEPPPEQ